MLILCFKRSTQVPWLFMGVVWVLMAVATGTLRVARCMTLTRGM